MKSNYTISSAGFTLTEVLVNIIIVSTLTFSMMFVFTQIQKDFNFEEYFNKLLKV